MRLLFFLTLFTAAYALRITYDEHPNPVPAPKPANRLSMRTLRLNQYIKNKYAELFPKNKRQDTGNPICDGGSSSLGKRTAFTGELLSPEDAALYVLGRGTWTHSNGTTVTDEEYATILKEGEASAAKYSHVLKYVKSGLGNWLLELGLTQYMNWRNDMKYQYNAILWFSPQAGVRTKDLPAIERALLKHDWKEFQVWSYRIERRLAEAVVEWTKDEA